MKIIITGSTGMVGEGVLLACLQDDKISEILSISRKSCGIENPKLKELLLPDFTKIEEFAKEVKGYDACFFCAGISSVGMSEERYKQVTYDTTMAVAEVLSKENTEMTFIYVSGTSTDSTGQGKIMWARIKGKTENDLMKLPFKNVLNFRPGAMLPISGQKYAKKLYNFIAKVLYFFMPAYVIPLGDLARAMINGVALNNVKSVFEIKDIIDLAKNR